MKLVIKLTISNIMKNKLRTFMIIFSILLSTALFYSIIGLSSAIEDIFSKMIKTDSGSAEIFISNDSLPDQGFSVNFENPDYFEYSKGVLQSYGYVKDIGEEPIKTFLQGYKVEDLKAIHDIDILSASGSVAFEGPLAVIGSTTADEYGLKPGDELNISINSRDCTLEIRNIAPDENNILSPKGELTRIVLPLSYLQEITGMQDSVTTYFIKTDADSAIGEAQAYLESNYSQYHISTIDDDSRKAILQTVTVPMLILVLVVVLISFYIIHSAFKVISIERLPFVGIMRSIGSTKKATGLMLLCESLVYGVLGGILGTVLGVFVVYLISISVPGGSALEIKITFDTVNGLIALVGAVTLSALSALGPVVKTLGISIKDIVTNTLHNTEDLKLKRTVTGAALIAMAFVLFMFAPESVALPMTILGILLLPVGVSFMIPFLILVFCGIIEFFIKLVPSPQAKLAVSNIRHDKTLHNNIVLMSIGLGVILLVNIIISSIMIEVMNVYDKAHYDILMQRGFDEAGFDSRLSATPGVSSAYRSYETWAVEVGNSDFKIGTIASFDERYLDEGWHIELGADKEKALSGIRNQKGVIVSATMAKTHDLDVGDLLDLETQEGAVAYTIVAISPHLLNNGQVAFISPENFLADFSDNYGIGYYIGTSMPADEVKKHIKDRFPSEELNISTLEETREQNLENNRSVTSMMRGVSIIAMLIGIVGIFNNFIISYISRKRNLSVMRSMGLEKRKLLRMLIIESLFCGLMGSIIGILTGILFVQSLVYVFSLINMPAIVHYPLAEIFTVLVSGIAISMLASAAPALRMNKTSIVQNLKYE